MRLKHIKLVGFKSFVDPTKVPFPHQMTCVVGPNGCGKSNVIDAVRWVLGESSAKNLRGDAMTDVIFNGSGARKPVSQASVELVFDNSSGRIQGEYANYAEISVKRLVTRDGRSDYFLNNSKCRRRDITDLFLGTGLGPRSYAIIEQGMISRLIESKPQELRIFIEEAAGISKYKERRRETENRIQHTRDNLDRLNDVRDELGTQLDKLQRQAAAARRYTELKKQERKFKAELQALRWLNLEQQAERLRQTIREHEAELEKWLAEQRGSERGTTELREQTNDIKAKLDKIQEQFYQLGNEITRTEHQLQRLRTEQQQRLQREQQLQAELTQLNDTYQRDVEQEVELKMQLEELQPETELLALGADEAQQRFQQHELAWEALQRDYQAFLDAQQQQRAELQQVQLQQERIGADLQRATQQRNELQAAADELKVEQQRLAASEVAEQLAQAETEVAAANEWLQQVAADQLQLREQCTAMEHQQQQLQRTLQQQLGRQSSLQTLLTAAQQTHHTDQLASWLQQRGHTLAGTVRELLNVDDDWRFAAEQVLTFWLSAVVVNEQLEQWPSELGSKVVTLTTTAAPPNSLAAQVQGPLRQWTLLQRIALVTDTEAAQKQLADPHWLLALTQNGAAWGPGSFQAAHIEAESSQLLQQAELAELEQEIAAAEQGVAQLETQQQQQQTQLLELEQQQQQARDQLNELQAQVATWREKQKWEQQQLTQLQDKAEQIEQRSAALATQVEEWQLQREELTLQLEMLEQRASEGDLESWQQQREQLQGERQQLREQAQQQQQQAQEKKIQVEQLKHQAQSVRTLIQRLEQQQQQTQEQLSLLQQPDADSNEETEILAMQLEELLAQREMLDQDRRDWANKLAELEQQLHDVASGAKGVETQIEKARQKLQSSQMELAALQERTRNVLAVLDEMQQPLKPVLEELSENADEKAWQQEVERLQSAIARLGAINLAAIEEAETLGERKSYLDQQHEDLSASLETLETAIRKIDKETRQRFKTTYDAVNSGLQELFPKVFGGGSAYLELTEDDLLETGVAIMARPPGKKNSTIHLLSGGEKALTALSLVFAIFRLNPAPFCLLDEVDAPLDDANVGRFCRLVEEMSQTVQFIYISHNKVAMEMASHLAGVTMQEPGVSRLVAVDVDEAVALTEAS
ncbi:chromosome segregation protein SMC [Pseudidiomarina salilacus]|uniref:chromosome segregation protein SMC n=1 Tax=Pseudidiomarina salilacus TaxID=3384452 RepID=UPI003985037A